jgi:hypothetical protein
VRNRIFWAPLAPAVLRATTFALALLTLIAAPRALASVNGFTPPAGYQAEAFNLQPEAFAVSESGTAMVFRPAGSLVVQGHTPALAFEHPLPGFLFVGGVAFAGPATLLLSENGALHTVFALDLRTGALAPLAPAGAVPNPGKLAVRADGAVFVVSAGAPGGGAVYRVLNGRAIPFATGLGTGYLGGIAVDRLNNLYVTDTNDPQFQGNPGQHAGVPPTRSPAAGHQSGRRKRLRRL